MQWNRETLDGEGRFGSKRRRVKQGRISQTALKVALSLVTLSIKDDWGERLPPDLVSVTERLLVASGAPGYGPRVMRASKRMWMLRIYELLDWMLPRQFEGFGHRKIFIQAQVELALGAGVRQVVVLGAGFDTLCLRLAPRYPEVEFVEVDHPATGTAKAKGIAAIGRPPNMLQILVDLGERSLEETLLAEHRFDPETPSVFVAEGLLQYLSDDEVEGMLKTAAAVAPTGSRFVLTHAIPGTARWMLGLASLIGEPWKSAVSSEALPDYVRGSGWSVITPLDDDASHGVERYAVAERE